MYRKTIAELSRQLAAREISSVELTRSYLERIERLNGTLNAFITVDAEKSLAQARAADERIARGDAAALTGIPIAHKDLFCAKGWLTTCGSRMLADWVSPYDAHVIEQFNAAGAVMLGKTNMDEFAMGSSNENSFFGPVHNPLGLERGALVAAPAAPPPPWPRASRPRPRAPTRADRFASRRPSPAPAGCARPMGACRATAWSPSPRRSIRPARSPRTPRISRTSSR
jgi:hypothetical protein